MDINIPVVAKLVRLGWLCETIGKAKGLGQP
jgi:hypothetical protein